MEKFSKQNSYLTQKEIFLFWFPLALTWLMMSIEGPYLSALIARLPNAKINLAAYGISFSLAMIFEAPVIMTMSASTALTKDYSSYLQLKKFNIRINLILTTLLILFNIPQIFFFVTERLIELPNNVSILAHQATLALIPFPASIGIRRFYQGILIRNKETKFIALGTVIRLIAMSVTEILLYYLFKPVGALVGAISLSAGVIIEAVFIIMVSIKTIKQLKSKKIVDSVELDKLTQKKDIQLLHSISFNLFINDWNTTIRDFLCRS